MLIALSIDEFEKQQHCLIINYKKSFCKNFFFTCRGVGHANYERKNHEKLRPLPKVAAIHHSQYWHVTSAFMRNKLKTLFRNDLKSQSFVNRFHKVKALNRRQCKRGSHHETYS